MRAAFGAYADHHSKASVRRAWSSWHGLFDHLVAEDVVEGNPMPAIDKPKRERGPSNTSEGTTLLTGFSKPLLDQSRRSRESFGRLATSLLSQRSP
jgi:integrase/recombinase XerC